MTSGQDVSPGGPARWYVVIEQTVNFGNMRERRITHLLPVPDRAAGRELAGRLAFEFQPMHPASKQSRSVFAGVGDVWLVLVRGATATFHFRLSVLEWLGDLPA